MKKLLLPFLFISSVYAQNKPYSITHQDMGTVIKHPTCRLVVHAKDLKVNEAGGIYKWGDEYLNGNVVELLSIKGYRVLDATGDYNSINFYKDVLTNDLTLSLEVEPKGNKIKFNSQMGYIDSVNLGQKTNVFNSNNIDQLSTFSSSYFRQKIKSKYYKHTKKSKKVFFELMDSIPDCVSTDSGHSYEEEKYNSDIPLSELNSCIKLYEKDLLKLKMGRYSNVRQGSGLVTAVSFGFAFAYPIMWPVMGAFGGYYLFETLKTSVLEPKLESSLDFLKLVKQCHLNSLNGQNCDESKFQNGLLSLRKTDHKKVNKYLDHMTSTELVQKITDFLSTEKSCSKTASKVKKVTMKKVLNKVEKTF